MEPLTLAQSLPIDPQTIITQGPLGILVVFLFWLWGKERDEASKERQAHRAEMAAKDARINELQGDRLDDQKTLIPLASSITTTLQQSNTIMARMADK